MLNTVQVSLNFIRVDVSVSLHHSHVSVMKIGSRFSWLVRPRFPMDTTLISSSGRAVCFE